MCVNLGEGGGWLECLCEVRGGCACLQTKNALISNGLCFLICNMGFYVRKECDPYVMYPLRGVQ